MKILYYTSLNKGAGERLQRIVEPLAEKMDFEIYRSIPGLTLRLTLPKYDVAVAVLLANNKKALLDLLSIRDLLSDIPIILILPDRQYDTVSKGHKLHPRFLSYVDCDFSDVCAVLKKMIANIRYGERIHWQLLDRMEQGEQTDCLS